MCSDELPDAVKQQGFKGVQTLPRLLTYEPLTKTLRAYPVTETNTLRGKQVCAQGCGSAAGSRLVEITLSLKHPNMADICHQQRQPCCSTL
jgi:hypothetical protein